MLGHCCVNAVWFPSACGSCVRVFVYASEFLFLLSCCSLLYEIIEQTKGVALETLTFWFTLKFSCCMHIAHHSILPNNASSVCIFGFLRFDFFVSFVFICWIRESPTNFRSHCAVPNTQRLTWLRGMTLCATAQCTHSIDYLSIRLCERISFRFCSLFSWREHECVQNREIKSQLFFRWELFFRIRIEIRRIGHTKVRLQCNNLNLWIYARNVNVCEILFSQTKPHQSVSVWNE